MWTIPKKPYTGKDHSGLGQCVWGITRWAQTSTEQGIYMVILFNTNESYFYNWRLEFILCNSQILFLSEDKRGILLLNSLSYPGSKFQLMCVSDAFEQVHINLRIPGHLRS